MIRLEQVCCAFDGVEVLSEVSFEVATGATVGLIGVGGAGKSLILKLICGLVRPSSGRVFIDDVEVSALSERALMPIRRHVGMIFQNYALFDDLTVGDNIAYPLRQLGALTEPEIQAEVDRRLAQVHLPDIAPLMPNELSGGMKKRVCLARAIVHEPDIMLCDDPTAGLDPVTTRRIFNLLMAEQRAREATCLIVSHEVVAIAPLCARFIMLEGGRVVFDDTPEAATRPSAPASVRQFVTGEGVA